jgi:thiamine monophosphate synthase
MSSHTVVCTSITMLGVDIANPAIIPAASGSPDLVLIGALFNTNTPEDAIIILVTEVFVVVDAIHVSYMSLLVIITHYSHDV